MTENKEVFDIDHEVCKPLASWVGVREVKSQICLFKTQPHQQRQIIRSLGCCQVASLLILYLSVSILVKPGK